MKNIVFVFNPGCYPVPAINGGAVEALVTNLINENEIQQQFNFHVIMCKNTNDKTNYDYSNYKYTKFYDYYQKDFNFKFDRIVNGVNKRLNYALPLYSNYEKYILSTIKSINPDQVIFEGSLNSTVRKLRKLYGKNKLSLHVHHQMKPKYKIDKYFGNMISCSEFVKRDWQNSNKLSNNFNYQILNNVLTSSNFKNKTSTEEQNMLRKKLGINNDDFVVVFCGRLLEVKGVDILIKAIKDLNNKNIKLMIIGESGFKNSKITPYVEYLKNLVGEDKNVIFTGYVDNPELYKYYSLANLQVICSICEEAAPVTAIEGCAVGLPQLITNSGGLPEYANKNAIIVDKSYDLQKKLSEEIKNFYDGKYKNLNFKNQKIGTLSDYYNQFKDLMNN